MLNMLTLMLLCNLTINHSSLFNDWLTLVAPTINHIIIIIINFMFHTCRAQDDVNVIGRLCQAGV